MILYHILLNLQLFFFVILCIMGFGDNMKDLNKTEVINLREIKKRSKKKNRTTVIS